MGFMIIKKSMTFVPKDHGIRNGTVLTAIAVGGGGGGGGGGGASWPGGTGGKPGSGYVYPATGVSAGGAAGGSGGGFGGGGGGGGGGEGAGQRSYIGVGGAGGGGGSAGSIVSACFAIADVSTPIPVSIGTAGAAGSAGAAATSSGTHGSPGGVGGNGGASSFGTYVTAPGGFGGGGGGGGWAQSLNITGTQYSGSGAGGGGGGEGFQPGLFINLSAPVITAPGPSGQTATTYGRSANAVAGGGAGAGSQLVPFSDSYPYVSNPPGAVNPACGGTGGSNYGTSPYGGAGAGGAGGGAGAGDTTFTASSLFQPAESRFGPLLNARGGAGGSWENNGADSSTGDSGGKVDASQSSKTGAGGGGGCGFGGSGGNPYYDVGPSYTFLGEPHYGEASPGVILLFW